MVWLQLAADGDATTRATRSSTALRCTTPARQPRGGAILERAAGRHPGDADILGALVAFSQQAGDAAAARRWAGALKAAQR